MVTLARRALEALDADPPRVNRARWFVEELLVRAENREVSSRRLRVPA